MLKIPSTSKQRLRKSYNSWPCSCRRKDTRLEVHAFDCEGLVDSLLCFLYCVLLWSDNASACPLLHQCDRFFLDELFLPKYVFHDRVLPSEVVNIIGVTRRSLVCNCVGNQDILSLLHLFKTVHYLTNEDIFAKVSRSIARINRRIFSFLTHTIY